MRIFYAIDLDQKTKIKIGEAAKRISKYLLAGRMINIYNYHITVEFIGEVDIGKVEKYITQSEFARRIGTSRQNVSYAIKNGTIKFSNKDPKLINWDTQKVAYEQNRNLSQVRVRPPSKQLKSKAKPTRKYFKHINSSI